MDLISRQAVNDVLHKARLDVRFDSWEDAQAVQKAIDSLPSAQKTRREK